MRSFVRLGLICTVAIAAMSTSVAQDKARTPEEQAKQAKELRQSVFKLMGWNMDPLAGMLRNRIPFDAAVAQKSAARIESLAPMIPDVFQTDTRKFKGDTHALDSIWTSKSDFDAKASNLSKAAADLTAAAKTGDKGATLKAAAAVGKACGSCHDDFREKE